MTRSIKTLRLGEELRFPTSLQIFQLGKHVAKGDPAACFLESGDADNQEVTDTGTPMVVVGGSEEGKAKPLYREELALCSISSVHRRSVTCWFLMPMNITYRADAQGHLNMALGTLWGKMPFLPEAILKPSLGGGCAEVGLELLTSSQELWVSEFYCL